MKAFTGILLTLICLPLIVGSHQASVSAQELPLSPEEQLAERYAPIAYLRYQQRDCGAPPYEGEPYLPLPVDMVLNNERVLIRDAENGDEVIAAGPSAQELARFGPDTYMDFPGDPRRPGCTYENDERLRVQDVGMVPTTYANVIFDPVEGRVALQYWFYYYFNHWNNTHESDWEGIQLVWDQVESLEAALDFPPSRVGYAQHGNGEIALWGDEKLILEDGTRPVIYPAAGSHATFFSNDTFLAWGERNSGFGCDVSAPPSVRTPLDVVLIPSTIEPDSEFAWLLYEGRWGERQPGAFNGPRGPMFNKRWNDPFEIFETWRPFSIVVPGSQALGPSMADAFCAITGAGSTLLIEVMVRPWVSYPVIAAVIGAILFFSRTSIPILRQAASIYRRNFRLFIGIGVVSLPIGIIFNGIQAFLIGRQPLKFIVDWLNDTGGARLTAVMAIGGIQQFAMLLIVTPALVYAVQQVLEGNELIPPDAYSGVLDRAKVISTTFVLFVAVVGLLLVTAIGFPVAIWLAVSWHFFVQVLVFDRSKTPLEALRRSRRIVQGSWLKVVASLLLFDLLAIIPGILVGFGLLTIGRTAVGFANGISSLLYAVLMPLSAIAVTLLYLDRRDNVAADTAQEDAVDVEETKPNSAVIAQGNA